MDNSQCKLVDMPKIEKLLKGSEVASLLNISRSRAYILMQTGVILTVRIGKSRRVRPQDLNTFIEHHIYSSENFSY